MLTDERRASRDRDVCSGNGIVGAERLVLLGCVSKGDGRPVRLRANAGVRRGVSRAGTYN